MPNHDRGIQLSFWKPMLRGKASAMFQERCNCALVDGTTCKDPAALCVNALVPIGPDADEPIELKLCREHLCLLVASVTEIFKE